MTAPMPKDNEVDEKVIARFRATGDYAYPVDVAEDGEYVLYDDHAATVSELRAKADAAERRAGELEKLMAAARRAIGDHHAPNDCYATGPLTGDAFLDLVQCPACAFLDQYANSTKVTK